MRKNLTKEGLGVLLNELTAMKSRYRPVKEEKMPTGFFSTAEMAKKYGIAHRVMQKWVSESLSLKELEVRFVRRRTNEWFVRKIPVYKFKTKADAKSFKSRHKGKR
jgi:hypothetical protein